MERGTKPGFFKLQHGRCSQPILSLIEESYHKAHSDLNLTGNEFRSHNLFQIFEIHMNLIFSTILFELITKVKSYLPRF